MGCGCQSFAGCKTSANVPCGIYKTAISWPDYFNVVVARSASSNIQTTISPTFSNHSITSTTHTISSMAATLNGVTQAYRPMASLEIKYVSRLPTTTDLQAYHPRPLSMATSSEATIVDLGDSWRISATSHRAADQSNRQTIEVEAWPMFSPENARLVASATTDEQMAGGRHGRVELDIAKRELADFDESSGRWLLPEGIYMFEIRGTTHLNPPGSLLKQVSVVGSLSWSA